MCFVGDIFACSRIHFIRNLISKSRIHIFHRAGKIKKADDKTLLILTKNQDIFEYL